MRAVILGLVLLLLLLAQPALTQVPDDLLIVPGQRIGKWTVGMTINDLLKMNGPRNAIGYPEFEHLANFVDMTSKDYWLHHWEPRLALTSGRNSQKIMALAVERGNEEKIHYKTDKGVGPNSMLGDLYRAYLVGDVWRPTAVTVAAKHAGPYEKFTVILDNIGLAAWVWGPSAARQRTPGQIDVMFVFRPGTAKSIWKY